MAVWKRICCPVDYAEPSRHALVEAAELARRLEGELTVVSVMEHKPSADTFVAPPELFREEAEQARRQLDHWVADAESRAPGRVRGALLSGAPAEEIIKFLRDGRFDLVAMGTHGRKGLKRLVLGSVAERVVREAPCTVLVVRPERFESEPD
jgi:nucleotide-binding universal stress UspA family protein